MIFLYLEHGSSDKKDGWINQNVRVVALQDTLIIETKTKVQDCCSLLFARWQQLQLHVLAGF